MRGEKEAPTTLYRCPTPTDWLCRCGTVARALRRHGVDYTERRVPLRRGERDDIEGRSGQRHVPVLEIGDELICDSRRILEHLDWRAQVRQADGPGAGAPAGR